MAEPSTKDLLSKLSGKKVQLTTRCGSFQFRSGVIQQVFEGFFLFVTQDERLLGTEPVRNWVWSDNVALITEEPKVGAEDLAVTRYEI